MEESPEKRPAPYKPEDINIDEEAKLQADGGGENFHRYKEQKVTCIPLDVVKPIEKFNDILKSELLLRNVASLGYTEMTPIQKWAMPAIIDGHDIIGCAQTGSGKTAAFLLPILQTLMKTDLESHDPNSDCQNPYCLIISPTRELANQLYVQAEMLARDSIVACRVIYGQISTIHLKSKLSQGCHVLVATPGRLRDFVERGWIGFSNIKYVILDEGDRLVGEGFMGSIKEFFDHPSMPTKENRQTLFFSATFKQEVQTNAKEFLKETFVFLTVGRVGAANEDIKQEFLQVARTEKKRELKKILASVPETDKTIVFTQTKNAADMLATFFTQLNLSSTSIHGDRHQSQREQAISTFKKGEKRFLISSPVGNRGLDLPKVALVINYDLPESIDEYVHRIGRTGRAGHTGRAISFFDADRDRELLPCLLQILEEAKQEIPEWMKNGDFSGAATDDWATGATNDGGATTTEDWGASTTTDDWGGGASTTDEAKKSTDDWGSGTANDAPKESADDWGSGAANTGPTKSTDDWGSSATTSETNKTTDDWGTKSSADGASSNDWSSGGSNNRGRGAYNNNRGRKSGNDWGSGGADNWGAGGSDNGANKSGNDWGGKSNNNWGNKSGSDWQGKRDDNNWAPRTPNSQGGGGFRGRGRGRGRGGFNNEGRSNNDSWNSGASDNWGSSGNQEGSRRPNNDSGNKSSNDWGNKPSNDWGNKSSNDQGNKTSADDWGNGSADDWGAGTSGENKRKADEPAGNPNKKTDQGDTETKNTTSDDWTSSW